MAPKSNPRKRGRKPTKANATPAPSPGAPSIYTPELATKICNRIAAGESLKAICADEGMPAKSTVLEWVVVDRQGFADLYARACATRAEHWAEEIIEQADDLETDPQRSRLQVDTRKWLMSKLRPDRFGDKLTVAGDESKPLTVRVVRA